MTGYKYGSHWVLKYYIVEFFSALSLLFSLDMLVVHSFLLGPFFSYTPDGIHTLTLGLDLGMLGLAFPQQNEQSICDCRTWAARFCLCLHPTGLQLVATPFCLVQPSQWGKGEAQMVEDKYKVRPQTHTHIFTSV